MSTCPEKDIHSLYLDNELPEVFIPEYKAHLESCPKCAAELEKMRTVHEALQADSRSINLDKVFLDQSFERLQSRMRYAKVVSQASSEEDNRIIKFPGKKTARFIPAAVAAAAVFALMLPFSMRKTTIIEYGQLSQIKRTNSALSVNNPTAMANTMNASFTGNLAGFDSRRNGYSNYSLDSFIPAQQVSNAAFGNMVPVQVSRSQFMDNADSSYSTLMSDDFFRPEFPADQNADLRVYMPSIVDISSLNNAK